MCCGFACLGTLCVGCCCSGLKDCQAKHGPASRVGYVFFMFVMCIVAVIMALYGDTEIYKNDFLNIEVVVCDPEDNEACQDNGSVYRISFCLFLFFIIHAAVVRGVAAFHHSFLTWKLMIFIIVLVATYFLPNDIFDGYASFARIASFFFLLLQVVILISWAYDVNDRVMEKIYDINVSLEEDGSDKGKKGALCCTQFALVIATVCIYIAIGIFIGFQFSWFNPSKGCSFNSTMIGLTIVWVLLIGVVPIMLQTGFLFTTAVVSFYVTYLCFAGLENFPDEDCNTFAQNENTTTMWVGIIVTSIAISYIGFSVSSKSGMLLENGGAQPNDATIDMELQTGTNKSRGKDTGDDAGTAGSNYDDDADLGESAYDDAAKRKGSDEVALPPDAAKLDQKANVMFHLCMAFAAIYMAMLYTNWGTNTYNNSDSNGRSMSSVWVNIAAQWVTCVLFLWTAVAPKVCPSRFGQDPDE